MEKRFSIFSMAALAFAIVLALGIPTVVKAAGDMSQKGMSPGMTSGSDHNTDMKSTQKDQTWKTGEYEGKMDKERSSMSEMDKSSSHQYEQELSSMSRERGEIITGLPERERHEFFTLSREERDRFFSLKPRERDFFFSLQPRERTEFFALSPRERGEIITLKPRESHEFFSMNRQERHKWFSAKPDERRRMLSRAESNMTYGRDTEKGEMSSRDAGMRKDTDRPRNMKSDQGISGRDMNKSDMDVNRQDKGATKSDMDANLRQKKTFDRDMGGQTGAQRSGGGM